MKIHLSPEQSVHLLTFSDQFVISCSSKVFLDIQFLMLKGEKFKMKTHCYNISPPQLHWLQKQHVSYVKSNIDLFYRECKEQSPEKGLKSTSDEFQNEISASSTAISFQQQCWAAEPCQALSCWRLQCLQHTFTKVCWLLMPKRMFSMWLKNVNVLLGWAWIHEIPVLQNRWDGLRGVLRMAFSRARSLAELRACRAARLPCEKGDVPHMGAQGDFSRWCSEGKEWRLNDIRTCCKVFIPT